MSRLSKEIPCKGCSGEEVCRTAVACDNIGYLIEEKEDEDKLIGER